MYAPISWAMFEMLKPNPVMAYMAEKNTMETQLMARATSNAHLCIIRKASYAGGQRAARTKEVLIWLYKGKPSRLSDLQAAPLRTTNRGHLCKPA